jgi:hypothetical protein
MRTRRPDEPGRGRLRACATVAAIVTASAVAMLGYPLDGINSTKIRRLLGYRLSHEGKIKGWIKLPPGGLIESSKVVLRMKDAGAGFELSASTPKDAKLQAGLEKIFAGRDRSYNIALLEISDPSKPRYAAIRADSGYVPGSVAKILIANGMFAALRNAYPNDTAAREKLLRETMAVADSFVHPDGKTVPFFNEGDPGIVNRRLEVGDKFNLYEWMDHMLSQSSNAAASFTWKQAMLLYKFGKKYPLPAAEEAAFFKETPKRDLSVLAQECLVAPLREEGLNPDVLKLGMFFTANANKVIPSIGGSHGTPNELMRMLIKMEQGKLVDAWSSLEMKRLLYFSRPRYRYAASPALDKSAVFFKSGSLYECVPERRGACPSYQGDKLNLMHSVAVVESGAKVYLVVLMSNVLKLNSAVEHQTIATLIHGLLQQQ